MDDETRDLDEAVETATDRTQQAQLEFLQSAEDRPDAVHRALKVERRAEDLAVLAEDDADRLTEDEDPDAPIGRSDSSRR
jgi:hypothetical protein